MFLELPVAPSIVKAVVVGAFICNLVVGPVVPIPTLPVSLIVSDDEAWYSARPSAFEEYPIGSV